MEAAPHRTLTLVGLDNVGVASGDMDGVGAYNFSTQGAGGAEVLKMVNDLGMALPGTLWKSGGPTYYSAENAATTPDHWLIPKELCGAVKKCMTY